MAQARARTAAVVGLHAMVMVNKVCCAFSTATIYLTGHYSTALSSAFVMRKRGFGSNSLIYGSPLSMSGPTPNTSKASTSTTVISQAYIDDDSSAPRNRRSRERTKLTRPERKAQQRRKKEEQAVRRKRQDNKRRRNSSYNLHSTAVSCLTKDSTPDEVVRAIKRAQNLHDEHDIRNIERFLIEEVDESYAYGYRGSLLARLAVAALHMNNHELARVAIDVRRTQHRSSLLPLESDAIVRGLLRVHNVSDAMDVINDELSLPLQGTLFNSDENRERLKHRALALASVASRHFYEMEPEMALKACSMLVELGPVMQRAELNAEDIEMPWARIIQGAAKCESCRRDGLVKIRSAEMEIPCNLVYAVLNAMTAFPPDNNDEIYESLSNALVRRTVFVKGAVDMEGLPEADRAEAVFIGRSNVGKSSLVNMVTNRKSLAYTSKTPGKTQQFNYFAVNDKPGLAREIKYGDVVSGSKDPDSFYLVDLPGFGYAKVPQEQRERWMGFMDQYLATRETLRVVFHLIDARHGATREDERIMKDAGTILPEGVTYVVVLTKADKKAKGSPKMVGTVSPDVMDKLKTCMKKARVGNAPIVLTSALNNYGRDEMWRYLMLAAEG